MNYEHSHTHDGKNKNDMRKKYNGQIKNDFKNIIAFLLTN